MALSLVTPECLMGASVAIAANESGFIERISSVRSLVGWVEEQNPTLMTNISAQISKIIHNHN
ncbi:hypothetical protein [Nostoc sp.]